MALTFTIVLLYLCDTARGKLHGSEHMGHTFVHGPLSTLWVDIPNCLSIPLLSHCFFLSLSRGLHVLTILLECVSFVFSRMRSMCSL
jgi:hypothetical protein